MRVFRLKVFIALVALCALYNNATPNMTVDPTTATIQALRLDGVIAGGAIPATDPVFTAMVADIESGNYTAAAAAAINSTYFPYYLPRRMAKEMMNPAMSEQGIPDNDAEVFIVANWLGLAGTQPSMSAIWSQNATYCINTTNINPTANQGRGLAPCSHPYELNIADINNGDVLRFDWTTLVMKENIQTATPKGGEDNAFTTGATIGAADVGGYMTLEDPYYNNNVATGPNSFAQYAFLNGTNLRAAEYMYEISLGTTLPAMEVTSGVTADMTPRFIPSNNPNFLVGNNQPACIACHGGGATSLEHGYAVFADKFDWDSNVGAGLVYIPNPSYRTDLPVNPPPGGLGSAGASWLGKSYGSNTDQQARLDVAACNLTATPGVVCNPSSPGIANQAQGWNLSLWQTSGLLSQWGWNGPISGNGLNSLGTALGQATQVYTFMTQRVINEICPGGTFTQAQIDTIANGAMSQESAAQKSASHVPASQGAYGYIIIQIATDPSCI